MPVHDWTRVDGWVFYSFHLGWVCAFMKSLNTGLLPPRYYAMVEWVETAVPAGRHVAVRHVTDHRIVALIEIVSPANKDRRDHVRDFVGKVVRTLESGVHVLVLDLLPPGRYDVHGLHGAVWAHFDTTPYDQPADGPLTLASYAWDGAEPSAFVEPVAVGGPLAEMPLFLTADRYVNVPLEPTYQAAYGAMPHLWREVLERPAS